MQSMKKFHVVSEGVEMPAPVVEIVLTQPHHLRELAKNMRTPDEAEIVAFGLTPEKALWRAFKNSIMTKTALIDGEVAAIWGVRGNFMGAVGRPWLLTGKAVNRVSPLKFTRIYQQEAKQMLLLFPKLSSIVDAEYAAAIRLLSIVGFTLDKPAVMGSKGKLFVGFERVR